MVPLIRAVYAELGIGPVFELVPVGRGLGGTNSGTSDADMARVSGSIAGHPHLILTSEPLLVLIPQFQGATPELGRTAGPRWQKRMAKVFHPQEALHEDLGCLWNPAGDDPPLRPAGGRDPAPEGASYPPGLMVRARSAVGLGGKLELSRESWLLRILLGRAGTGDFDTVDEGRVRTWAASLG